MLFRITLFNLFLAKIREIGFLDFREIEKNSNFKRLKIKKKLLFNIAYKKAIGDNIKLIKTPVWVKRYGIIKIMKL